MLGICSCLLRVGCDATHAMQQIPSPHPMCFAWEPTAKIAPGQGLLGFCVV
jgi:hypothetical protein